MKKVIIIPGLGDHMKLTKIATKNWQKYGIEPIVYIMNWSDKENFESKLNKLSEFIKDLPKNDSKISVVGCSAGASAALNVFLKNQDTIDKAVSVCGRLRVGNQTGFMSLKTRAKTSSSFAESVKLFENQEKSLTDDQRNKILTIRSLFGDELVPAPTSTINGAKNVTIPTIEHTLSIYLALSFFSEKITNFLKNQADPKASAESSETC